MTDKTDLVSVDVLGRPVVFRQFNDLQLVLVHRMRQVLVAATALNAEELPESGEMPEAAKRALTTSMDTVSQFLTMLEGLAVDPLDRQWLVEQMLVGNLDLDAIAKFVLDMVPEFKKAAAEKKAPAKKATRAK